MTAAVPVSSEVGGLDLQRKRYCYDTTMFDMQMAQKIIMMDISCNRTIVLCKKLFVLFIWFCMIHYSIF